MPQNNTNFRIEKDSMGEIKVPADALYGAQTQRAVDNFPISGWRFPAPFIRAMGLIKQSAAEVNIALGLMDKDIGQSIVSACQQVIEGQHSHQFPLDIFQTGSGTSTNMNTNEVIAALATQKLGKKVHPNDHVNMGQSSNDCIPTAIHVSASLLIHESLIPSLEHLHKTLKQKAQQLSGIPKTGRTHLMDAMPVRFDQELGGWATQIANGIERVRGAQVRLRRLAQGGTAVGTGINAHPEFAARFAQQLTKTTGVPFEANADFFESLATQDAAVEMSGQLKTVAASVFKIANDLRWMNSGPLAGLAEIALPSLQPGSSIMPGKVNPVIPESAMMACTQIMGNDVTITMAGANGNFQLNVMLPVIAYNLLASVNLLANTARNLADKAIAGFTVNRDQIGVALDRNPILVTSLNSLIGYEKGAAIAKKAYAEKRTVLDVAKEMTGLPEAQLKQALDPTALTKGGIVGEGAGGG